MELIMIRHARPQRVEGASGGANPGLTDIGVRQAQAMASWLASEQIDALYSSPMLRARQTCDPLAAALGMEAVIDSGLREFDSGESEYIPIEEIRADKVKWRAWLDSRVFEPADEFVNGVTTAMAQIAAAHPSQRVAIVCHAGVINAYGADVLGLDSPSFFNADYTSINRFFVSSAGDRGVGSLNDVGHLRPHPELQLL